MKSHSFSKYKLKFNEQLYSHWQGISVRFTKFMKVNCTGLDKISNKEPAVLAPNHLNWKDIFVTTAMMRRPVSFTATRQLFDRNACYKLLSQYFRKYAHYPGLKNVISQFNNFMAKFMTDRVKNLGALPAKFDIHERSLLSIISDVFNENRLICIFPEGGLGLPGRLRRFKFGIAKILYDLYQENQDIIPAYPVGITGTHRLFRPGMKVGFHVGSPLYIKDYLQPTERETMKTFVNDLQNAVYDLTRS